MGGLLASLAPASAERGELIRRQGAACPSRGTFLTWEGEGAALGVLARRDEASLASNEYLVVAFHGFLTNLRELGGASPSNDPQPLAGSLLRLLEREGEAVLARLRGEFAVLVYDRRTRELLGCRDPLGCRPLFWTTAAGGLVFGSEIRQLIEAAHVQTSIHETLLVEHLLERPPLTEETLFRPVRKLLPARLYRFRNGEPEPVRGPVHWSIEGLAGTREEVKTFDQASEALLEALKRAVKGCLPTGSTPFVSLSGGLDSATVWSLALELGAEVRAVSLVFPGRPCDETPYQELLWRKARSEPLVIPGARDDLVALVREIAGKLDTIQYPTAYMPYLMSAAVREEGGSVLLTGHGGDHWLDGTRTYVADLLRSGRLRAWYEEMRRVRGMSRLGPARHLVGAVWGRLRKRFGLAEKENTPAWLGRVPPGGDLIEPPSANRPTHHWRERVAGEQAGWALQTWEQLGESQGVEARHPLMDVSLVELCVGLPPCLFFPAAGFKALLRSALRGVVPERVLTRKDKTAFDDLFLLSAAARRGLYADGEPWCLEARGLADVGREARRAPGACERDDLIWLLGAEFLVPRAGA